METYFEDKEIGRINIRLSAKAKHYSLKISNGEVWGIMPQNGDTKKLIDFILSKREEIKKALAKHPARALIDEHTVMQTATFRLKILCTQRNNFYMALDDGVLSIACPEQTRFDNQQTQDLLKDMISNALRHEAKRVLPSRIIELAKQHHFTITGIKINSSRTHWGSCTPKKSINLSLYLMLLPWHLIDYVLLHELCHTVEMNHSDRFWRLLDKITNGNAHSLRQEIKQHHML